MFVYSFYHDDDFGCGGSLGAVSRVSLVAVHRLSDCPVACGVLVPQSRLEPVSALKGGFLTTGSLGRPLFLWLDAPAFYCRFLLGCPLEYIYVYIFSFFAWK